MYFSNSTALSILPNNCLHLILLIDSSALQQTVAVSQWSSVERNNRLHDTTKFSINLPQRRIAGFHREFPAYFVDCQAHEWI